MADSLLSAALERLEEIQAVVADPESVGCAEDVVWTKANDASYSAYQALVIFRKLGDAEGRLRSLEALVRASVLLGDLLEAKMYAEDELAMIKRTGDKLGIARATELVMDCCVARRDNAGALAASESLLELCGDLGDGPRRASTQLQVARLATTACQHKRALESAEAALRQFQELDDDSGQERARRALGEAYCALGQPDRAPLREEALVALQGLLAAALADDHQAWSSAMEQLCDSGACARSDMQDLVSKAFELGEDLRQLDFFFEAEGVDAGDRGRRSRGLATEADRQGAYAELRDGGLSYGPRFRCMQDVYSVRKDEGPVPAVYACLQVDEAADFDGGFALDEWEKDTSAWSPGIIESALQSGTLCA